MATQELKKVTKKPAKKPAKKPETKAVTKKTVEKGKSPLVATGKYKTVRQLADELFSKKKDKLTFEELEKAVHANFKDSSFNKNHYSWYKYHILSKGEKGKRTA